MSNPYGSEALVEDYVTPIELVDGTNDVIFRYYLLGLSEVFEGEVELPDFVAALIGDINDDGEVGFGDFLILSDNFGSTSATKAEGDLTGDGSIDFADFLLLSDNFGASAAVTPVPEPAAYVLLSGVLFTARLSRPRRRPRR